jgi:alpha-glucuronidase
MTDDRTHGISMMRGSVVVMIVLVASLLSARPIATQARLPDEDGYELWLRYRLVSDPRRLAEYRGALTQLVMPDSSATLRVAREELQRGLAG